MNKKDDIVNDLLADLACNAVNALIEQGVSDDTIVPYWDGETLGEVKSLIGITEEEVSELQEGYQSRTYPRKKALST